MSEAVGFPDRVNGHRLYRRQELPGGDSIRPHYQCTACGATEPSYQDFRAYGCPGSDPRGAPLVDKSAIQTGGDRQ